VTNPLLQEAIALQARIRAGSASYQLTERGVALLKQLQDGAIPTADVELQLAAAVWLPNYAREISVKSKKYWHFGGLTPHLQITDEGRAYLRQLESSQ
jgi:hypothetical protein